MPKIRIDVNKLENGTADYISLVHRPANRIPFRIMKAHPDKETDMIDLGGKLDLADIRTVLKSEGKPADKAAPAPIKATLVGIVVEKSDQLDDEAKKEFAAAGIDLAHPVENDDDTITYVQGDEPLPEEVVIVKMNDHALALCIDLDAEQVVKGTVPFEEMYEEVGFILSPAVAMDGLQTIIKQAGEDDSLDATAKANQIAQDSAQTGEYAKRITEVLPELAITAGEIVQKGCGRKQKKQEGQAALDGAPAQTQKAEDELVDCPACSGAKCNVCDTGKVTKAEAESIKKAFPFKKKPEAAAAAAAEGGEAGAEGDGKMPMDDKKAPCAKADKSQEVVAAATVPPMDAAAITAAVTAALAPIQKSVSDLAADITAVKDAQIKQAADLAGVQTAVAKADKILKGTLIGGAPAADHQEGTVLKEDVGELGNIDTAYTPGVRRVQKGFVARTQDLQRISRR